MSGSPYASASGRLKAHLGEFLRREELLQLANAPDLGGVAKSLEGSPYGPELVRASAAYKGAELLEVAANRLLAERNRRAFESASFAGRAAIGTYLSRWDIDAIAGILAGKVAGRPVGEAEALLVSWRDRPMGMPAGAMTLDDLRNLLAQPTVEASASYLVGFGYGPVLLPLVEGLLRSHDIFPVVQALLRDYYARLLASLRYFQGDEWVVRAFVQAEIDERNAMLLLKAKEAELPVEEAQSRWIDGGELAALAIPELFGARSVPEMVTLLQGRFPMLPEGLADYRSERSLIGFEAALRRGRLARELGRMRSYPLSLAILLTYLLLAEVERSDLRAIVFGKLYELSPDRIEARLVGPRL